MRYKLNTKNIPAQLTVMASLLMPLIISLIITGFKSVCDISYITKIKESCVLATEAAFAGYHNDMLKEYNIFLLKKSDIIDSKISHYINQNIEGYSKEIQCVQVKVESKEEMTSRGGAYLREEVLAYMKYGLYSDIINNLRNSEKQVLKAEKVNEITSDIVGCEETIYQMDQIIVELIELIEGVDTNEAGIVVEKGKPLASGVYFAKSIIKDNLSMDLVNVDNELIYKAVKDGSPGYTNIKLLLDDMIIDAEDLYEVGDEKSEESGNNSYANIYKRNYEKLSETVEETLGKSKEALDKISKYSKAKTSAETDINNCEIKINTNIILLGEELSNGFNDDLSEIKKDLASDKKKMCDLGKIEKRLISNISYLEAANSILDEMNVKLVKDNCQDIIEKTEKCKALLNLVKSDDLEFDYSGVDFSSSSIGLDSIKKVRELITDGIAALVLEDINSVSDKKTEYKDLATSISGEYEEENNLIESTTDTALFDEYLLSRFSCFSDYMDDEGHIRVSDSELMDYMIEYILSGKESDKENLESVMLKMSGIREGMNLAYLLTDKEKKNEALSMATKALGFTGSVAAVKAGQYVILAVWAYGEAIMDLQRLFKGNKVEFVKTSKDWKLSLTNLLLMRFDIDNRNNKSDNNNTDSIKEKDTGLNYKDYIKMLLLLENTESKNYRTMGAMELKMISLGHKDFRMKNYIACLRGEAVFKLKHRKNYYVQNIRYSYV